MVAEELQSQSFGAGRGIRARADIIAHEASSASSSSSRSAVSGDGQTAMLIKRGQAGTSIQLFANHFEVRHQAERGQTVQHYRVQFSPPEESLTVRKGLLKRHQKRFPLQTTFDGEILHSLGKFSDEILAATYANTRLSDKAVIKMTLTAVDEADPAKGSYLNKFYESICEKLLWPLNLKSMGPVQYDLNATEYKAIADYPVQILPGYQISLKRLDLGLAFSVQARQKVIEAKTVLELISDMRAEMAGKGGKNLHSVKQAILDELVGSVVLTPHNFVTYTVDDIFWNETPTTVFRPKDVETTYMAYYLQRYGLIVHNKKQPLLISNSNGCGVKIWNQGQEPPADKKDLADLARLIPELCVLTELNSSIRKNVKFMEALEDYLLQAPSVVASKVYKFVERINATGDARNTLEKWGFTISDNLIPIFARQLPMEQLIFKDMRNEDGELFIDADAVLGPEMSWSTRAAGLVRPIPLKTWICIVPAKLSTIMDHFINRLQAVARTLGLLIDQPKIVYLQYPHDHAYLQTIKKGAQSGFENDIQMVLVVLPENKPGLYSAIKKRLCVDYGIPSQCILTENVVVDRITIPKLKNLTMEMNCKLGGESWHINTAFKKMMVVGFDVCYNGAGAGNGSQELEMNTGAMVATTGQTFGKYYSTVSKFSSKLICATNMAFELIKCIEMWQRQNDGVLPKQILFFRNGVAEDEGELADVQKMQLNSITKLLYNVYDAAPPKFSFIVVDKGSSTILFKQEEDCIISNPGPGTVIDVAITYPGRYDFYLTSTAVAATIGTSRPTYYNVLHDSTGLDADELQHLTYKLALLYHNPSKPSSVPAPLQYASELANFAANVTKSECNQKLAQTLYFI